MAQRYHNGIPNEYLRMTGKSYMFAMRDKNFPRKFSDETKNIESQNEKSLIQKQISRTRHRATRVTTRTSNIPVRKERTSGVINKSLEKDLAPENALKSSVQSSRLNNQYQDQSVNNTSTPINPIPCINSNMDSKSKLITTKCQHSYAESYNVVKIPKKTSPTMKECDKVIQDIFQITRGGQNNRLARSNALSSGPRNDLNIASNFSKMKLSETLDSPNQGQSQTLGVVRPIISGLGTLRLIIFQKIVLPPSLRLQHKIVDEQFLIVTFFSSKFHLTNAQFLIKDYYIHLFKKKD